MILLILDHQASSQKSYIASLGTLVDLFPAGKQRRYKYDL